jgi:hypothetical protein
MGGAEMTMQPHYFGRAFDDRETRIMGEAFVMACHVVRAGPSGGHGAEVSQALQRDIASTVLQVAAFGVLDSATMAQAAIDRVTGAPAGP